MKLSELKTGDVISLEDWKVIDEETKRTHRVIIEEPKNGLVSVVIQQCVDGSNQLIEGSQRIRFMVKSDKPIWQ